MRVLVTYGSKHGGTADIAKNLGAALEGHGFAVVVAPAAVVRRIEGYDAVIIGGALYAERWHRDARRFLSRNLVALRSVPVWLFSGGPLDPTAELDDVEATEQVAVFAERIGALGHVTFGGRPPQSPADSHDWRHADRVRAWAADLAGALPTAKPGRPVEPRARSVWRWLSFAILGWAFCGATMMILLRTVDTTTALVLHAFVAPCIFALLAWRYFRLYGAREPLPTAAVWTVTVAVLDLVIVAGMQGNLDLFRSIAGTWLPFALIFAATWLTGMLLTSLPWAEGAVRRRRRSSARAST